MEVLTEVEQKSDRSAQSKESVRQSRPRVWQKPTEDQSKVMEVLTEAVHKLCISDA